MNSRRVGAIALDVIETPKGCQRGAVSGGVVSPFGGWNDPQAHVREDRLLPWRADPGTGGVDVIRWSPARASTPAASRRLRGPCATPRTAREPESRRAPARCASPGAGLGL